MPGYTQSPQPALERQDLSHTYLAHHDWKAVLVLLLLLVLVLVLVLLVLVLVLL